jgi:cardiolipin synthase
LHICVAANVAIKRPRLPWKGRKWPVVIGICVAVFGTLLYIAQDPQTLRIESRLRSDDPAFPDYVATLVNGPITRGDAYELLQNGDEIYPSMLAAIRGAKRRVALETYNFNEGDIGSVFADALVEAAGRGVLVRVILDSFGASAPPADLGKRLSDAGARVVWFNPLRPWTVEATNYRTHRKLLIVDGQVAFTGGVGVADQWLGHAQDEHHWRDTQFRITGPAVRLFEACFFENWVEGGGQDSPELDLDDPPPAGAARSIVIWSNPTGGVSNVKLLYLYSIAGAHRSIDIQSPYFIPDASVRAAFLNARRRGVRIRILTDGDITDARPVKHASRDTYQELLDAGIEVYEYMPTMMHAKAMVVDGVWSVFGSGNFDNRSLELNDEITVAVADPDLGRRVTLAFEADKTRSHAWRAADWRQRPWHWKIRERFWGLFGEVF